MENDVEFACGPMWTHGLSKTHVKLVARDLGGFDLPIWRKATLTG